MGESDGDGLKMHYVHNGTTTTTTTTTTTWR
jgi:hypothetical protein